MKRLFCFLALFALTVGLSAAVSVKGYYRKDGTYVAPHYRSSPNGTKADNYSTKGNVNPYTNKEGTKSADESAKEPAKTQTAPESQPNANAAPAAKVDRTYWLTTKSGVRHNSKCRYYNNSQGAPCTKSDGRACKLCGG